MRPATHLVWDWNGTLLDDLQAGLNAINAMLRRRGLTVLDRRTYRERFGFPVRPFYLSLGFDLEREDWDGIAHEFHREFLSDGSLRLHEGAGAVLQALHERGVPMSVLSALEQSLLDRMVDAAGLRPCFQHICGTGNLHGHSKLDTGRGLLHRLRLPPHRVLLVGDTLHDYEVAASLGTRCLLISNGHQSRARLQTSGVPVLDSLADIAAWPELR